MLNHRNSHDKMKYSFLIGSFDLFCTDVPDMFRKQHVTLH
jgi:hypothetical protein